MCCTLKTAYLTSPVTALPVRIEGLLYWGDILPVFAKQVVGCRPGLRARLIMQVSCYYQPPSMTTSRPLKMQASEWAWAGATCQSV